MDIWWILISFTTTTTSWDSPHRRRNLGIDCKCTETVHLFRAISDLKMLEISTFTCTFPLKHVFILKLFVVQYKCMPHYLWYTFDHKHIRFRAIRFSKKVKTQSSLHCRPFITFDCVSHQFDDSLQHIHNCCSIKSLYCFNAFTFFFVRCYS